MTRLQPTIAELTNRAIANRNRDLSADAGDVEPHEVLSGIRIDAQAAWTDAQLAPRLFDATPVEKSPPDWSAVVDQTPGRLGIPFASGQFPQMLRDIAGLFAHRLVEKASATSARESHGQQTPLDDAAVSVNERAAALWLDDHREEALAVWQTLPAGPVANFNLGMANLMLGFSKRAIPYLEASVESLPETTGWHHLAALYLSVAHVRD